MKANPKKYLSFGFFFCLTYELDKTISDQGNNSKETDHFVWNSYMRKSMEYYGTNSSWMDKIIQGFFGGFQIPGTQTKFFMFSRRSHEMGGTRFNARGINSYGYVANYVETE